MSVIAVYRPDNELIFTQPLYRYDYGQTLRFEGFNLPETFIVHFSNTEEIGCATTAIGQNDEVVIPYEYLRHHWDHLFAFIFIGDGQSGQTAKKIVIPVKNRPGLVDQIPSPVEESIIQQAINITATAIEKLNEASEIIERAQDFVDAFEDGNAFIDGMDAARICGGDI